MPSQKYRVLLMRDDQNVRRFGFNPTWFWLGVLTFIVLLVVAIVSVYQVFVLYDQNEDLKRQVEGLERELHAQNLELEHLYTVKKFFEANDPEELMALLGDMDAPAQPETIIQESDLSQLTREIDEGQLSVATVSLKDQEDGSMRLSFDLDVIDQGSTQEGLISLELIANDGRLLDLSAPADDLNYKIQRFKKVVTSFTMPEDIAMEQIHGLRITATDDAGDITFQKTFELETILAP